MTVFPQDTFQWLHALCTTSLTKRQTKRKGVQKFLKSIKSCGKEGI